MGLSTLRTALFALAAFSSQTALAQIQQGYSSEYGAPDVQVDRSVLEDLKGYQPPPMFATPTPDDTVTAPLAPITTPQPDTAAPKQQTGADLPATPSLTAPKAEEVLNHPVENLHVLTEHNSSLDQKSAFPMDSPLPVPTGQSAPAKPQAIAAVPPTVKALPPLPTRKPSLSPTTSTEPEIITVPTTTPMTTAIAADNKQSGKSAYRPKAEKLMPAVPPVKVEKSELASQLPPPPITEPPRQAAGTALPSLPPTATDETKPAAKKPSIGERLMDMALMRNIESDEDTIKEKLAETIDKPTQNKTEKQPAPAPQGLVFTKGTAKLTPEQEKQLEQEIIPRANKESQSRLQILAFASPTDGTESSARRISLSRALAVRDFLLTRKIEASRIDVRALANQGAGETVDRVDIVFVAP